MVIATDTAPSVVRISQIRPQPERLLVRRLKKAEKTSGGIVLPERTREVSQMGVVIAAGQKTTLPVGTWIIFSVYAAIQNIATDEGDEERTVFLREQDVLATVEEDG